MSKVQLKCSFFVNFSHAQDFFLNSHKLSFSLMLFPFSFLSPSPDLPPHPTFVSEITLHNHFSLDDSHWKLADYAHYGILRKVLFEYFFSNRLSARWHCCEFWWDGESTVTYVSKTPSLLISNSRVDQFYLCIEERRSFGIWKALSFLLHTGNFAVGLIHKYLLSTNYMQGTVLGKHPALYTWKDMLSTLRDPFPSIIILIIPLTGM